MPHNIAAELYGVEVTGIAFEVGENVDFTFELQNLLTRTAVDLTDASVVLSIMAINLFGQPLQPPVLAIAGAVQTPTTAGVVVFTLTPEQTAAIAPGTYLIDVRTTASLGGRVTYLPASPMQVQAGSGAYRSFSSAITTLTGTTTVQLGFDGSNFYSPGFNTLPVRRWTQLAAPAVTIFEAIDESQEITGNGVAQADGLIVTLSIGANEIGTFLEPIYSSPLSVS